MGNLDVLPGDIEDFRRDLSNSGLRSIDAFLEGRGGAYARIGKIAIAHTILWFEDREKLLGKKRANRHWYEYVRNIIRPGSNPDNLRENGLSIVTFNYDRSFEYYFVTAIQHSFGLHRFNNALDLFEDAIPVVHLHGEVGEASKFGGWDKPLNSQHVQQAANRIRVIHDEMAVEDERFTKARDLIAKADRIAFLGFSFHPTNVARLQIQQNVKGPTRKDLLAASRYLFREGEVERAKRDLGVDVHFARSDEWDTLRFLQEVPVLL